MSLGLGLVVVSWALLVGLAATFFMARRSGRDTLRARIGQFLEEPAEAETLLPAETVDDQPEGSVERSLEGRRWWNELRQNLDIGRIERRPIEVVYLTLGGSLTVGAVLYALTGSFLGLFAALVIGPFATRAIVNFRVRRQRALFSDQLPAQLQELAAALRVGHSLVSGLGVVAQGAAEPARGEFRRVLAEEQLGMPLETALRVVAVRMDARDMEQVSLVAELHRQTGGNMAEVLDRVAEAVRDRAELKRELRTMTTQARASRVFVTAIPLVLALFIEIVNPQYLRPLFDTGTGHVLLVVALGGITAGWLVMGRIVRIEL